MSEPTMEQKLAELESRCAQAAGELEESRKQLQVLERRQKIDELLLREDAVDLEAARLLTEVVVGRMSEEDVTLAVEELKGSKPFLFRRRAGGGGGGAMAARARTAPRVAEDAAEQAAESGNRNDLLRYLRMRRKGKS